MVTQEEIARMVGVSRSTVKAALSDTPKVSLSEETIRRVREAAARLDYRPNRIATAMRSGLSGIISMIHFGGVTQMAAQRSLAVIGAIQESGFQCQATDVAWIPRRVEDAVSHCIDARAQGVLIVCPSEWVPREQVDRLRQARIPIVAIAGVKLAGVPCIRADARASMARLTRHVLSVGHKKLALMVSLTTPAPKPELHWARLERIDGFRTAIAEVGGMVVDRDLTGKKYKRPPGGQVLGEVLDLHVPEDWGDPHAQGYERMKALIKQGQLPDAVLCSNDDWALGALTACSDAGLRVPQDVAITGFDNTLSSGYGAVPITTMADPLAPMARAGVDMLLSMIHADRNAAVRDDLVRMPCELVVRASCGAKLKGMKV